MASPFTKHYSIRLNLRNEQHARVHYILRNLNMDFHKSLNQFMINAIDGYVQSLDDDTMSEPTVHKREILTRNDLAEIQEGIYGVVSDSVITALGKALLSNQETALEKKAIENEIQIEDNSMIMDLANN